MPYEFLEDIATADIAFSAWGKDLEETFIAASDATVNVMVENLDSIQPLEKREFQLKNEKLDMLLFDLLQELIYYKDSEKLMLRVHQIQIKKEEGQYVLKAIALGERLDPNRHATRADVKAVTLHRFQLVKTDQGWKAQIILDI
jgi:SHS2 domain-containing protein